MDRRGARRCAGAALWLALGPAGLALLGLSCASSAEPSFGTESHWLDGCGDDRDCGDDGLRCVCGACTRDCRNDNACGESGDAICVNAESPLLVRRCGTADLPKDDGVCIARCTDDDECGGGTACVSGACVPLLSTPDATVPETEAGLPAAPDAAIDAGMDSGPTLQERLDEVATVDAAVSFEVPVALPPVDISITGGTQELAGSWREPDCEVAEGTLCGRLEIVRRRNGDGHTGSLVFDGLPYRGWGPLPEATDPALGYPASASTVDLMLLQIRAYPGVPYRMIDGDWDGTRLLFRWSMVDVWQRWCELQTPYPWLINGTGSYLCVPQDPAQQAQFDFNKRLLCRNPIGAERLTCNETSVYCGCDPTLSGHCPPPLCYCNATGCEADVRQAFRVELELTDGRLVGRLRVAFNDQVGVVAERAVTFVRGNP